jgi:hypothetical protein
MHLISHSIPAVHAVLLLYLYIYHINNTTLRQKQFLLHQNCYQWESRQLLIRIITYSLLIEGTSQT